MTFLSQTVRPSSTPDIVVPGVGCDSSIDIGDWVRITPSNFAVKAQADSIENSEVFGVVEDKTTNTICIIRVAGLSKPIFAGLIVNKTYFLSTTTSGTMELTIPNGTGEVIAGLGRPLDGERFLVQPTLRLQRT